MFKDPLTTIKTILSSIRQPVPVYMEFRGTDTILDRSLSRAPIPRNPEICTEDNVYLSYEDIYIGMASDYINEKDYSRLMDKLEKITASKPLVYNRLHSYEYDFIEILASVFYDDYTSEEETPDVRINSAVTLRLLQAKDATPYYEKSNIVSSIWKDEQIDAAVNALKKAITNSLINISKDFARYVDNMPYYGQSSSYVSRFPCSLTMTEAI